jgi:hypothetical protein
VFELFALAVEVVLEAVMLLPGNACAAASVSNPVSVILPAISHRLMWASLLSAASRV